MKKNIKKIVILSSTTMAATAGVLPILGNINSNSTTNITNNNVVNQEMSLDKAAVSYDQIANDYLKQNGNYVEKKYIGDLNAATSINDPSNVVNLNKLKEYDQSKIKAAYKTAHGEYVSNFDKARETYLKEPTIQWIDKSGNSFDSESEAKEYVLNNEKFTDGVAYYEVKDFSIKDANGQPTIVKINPLNPKDLDELKKIAIRNSNIPESGFTFNRLTTNDNKKYETNNFVGKDNKWIDNYVNSTVSDISNEIANNIWLSPTIVANPDQKFFMQRFSWNSSSTQVWTTYSTWKNPENKNRGVKYKDFVKEARYLVEKDIFKDRFELNGVSVGWDHNRKQIYKNAYTNKIFNGQEYTFNFDWSNAINNMLYPEMNDSDINFVGFGRKVNVWFDVYLNQDNFVDLLDTNATFKSDWEKHIESSVTSLKNLTNEKLSGIIPQNEIDSMFNSIQQIARVSLTTKLIPSEVMLAGSTRSVVELKNRFQSIVTNELIKKVSNISVNGKKFNELLKEKLTNQLQTNEIAKENDVIYTFNYNDSPLFRLKGDFYADDVPSEGFRVDPKKTIIDKFSKDIDNASKNLVNISNSYDNDLNKDTGRMTNTISKENIDSYNADSSKNPVKFTKKELNTSFDAKYKNMFIDESRIKEYGINSSELEKQLNILETDSIDYLNNKWGVLESLYQYNKNLESYLNKKNVTQEQKNKLEENTLKSANDIVVLFEKDKSLKTIKYGEFLNFGYKFNESLSQSNTSSIEVVNSKERKLKLIETYGLNKVSKIYRIKDQNNNVISETIVNSGVPSETAKQEAIKQALQKVKLDVSKEYSIYVDGENEVAVKNQVSNLHVLKINNTITNKNVFYGFAKYDEMKQYLMNYLQLTSANPNVVIPFNKNDLDAKVSDISNVISRYSSLEEINTLSPEQKFKDFGSILGFSNFEQWNLIIRDGINFSEITTRESNNERNVKMNIQLQNGYEFADKTSTTSLTVPFKPTATLPGIDDNNDKITNSSKNSTLATVAGVTTSVIVLIVLEVVLITTFLFNRKDKSDAEKKLARMYGRR